MKKRIAILAGSLALIVAASITTFAAATFSDAWKQDSSGNWFVQRPDGSKVTNAWLCDDAVPANGKEVWYLLDKSGNMISSPLVHDKTGNYYSLETEHNGYYGMLRYKSGVYGGVNLSLEGSHNGSFAAILNQDAINALKGAYGCTELDIDNSNIVYTSSFAKSGSSAGSTSSGMTTGSGSASAGAAVQQTRSVGQNPHFYDDFGRGIVGSEAAITQLRITDMAGNEVATVYRDVDALDPYNGNRFFYQNRVASLRNGETYKASVTLTCYSLYGDDFRVGKLYPPYAWVEDGSISTLSCVLRYVGLGTTGTTKQNRGMSYTYNTDLFEFTFDASSLPFKHGWIAAAVPEDYANLWWLENSSDAYLDIEYEVK